jgi:hypothetical protein
MDRGELRDITHFFASGLMTFSLDEFESYSIYKQFALSIIKEEVLKFNIRLHGGKIK